MRASGQPPGSASPVAGLAAGSELGSARRVAGVVGSGGCSVGLEGRAGRFHLHLRHRPVRLQQHRLRHLLRRLVAAVGRAVEGDNLISQERGIGKTELTWKRFRGWLGGAAAAGVAGAAGAAAVDGVVAAGAALGAPPGAAPASPDACASR